MELADDGLDIDALAEALRAGDVLYTIPTFQNPSGRTLSRENRFRLIELARSRGALVFEDDPYGELRFEGDPLPRLFELADGEGIVFLSSFSKTVAPGIRTGYVILPEELVPEIEALVLENYVSPAIFVEAALYDFVARGGTAPRAATSSGSTCRPASAEKLCWRRRRRMRSPSSREPTSSSTAVERKLRGSRTPSPPRRRSTRESAGSGGLCAMQPQSPPR